MKSNLFHWLLPIIISMTISDAFCLSQFDPSEKTLSLLKRYRQDYCKSLIGKQPQVLISYYADTIRLMPAFQKTVLGKNDAATYQAAFQKRFSIQQVTRNEIEILDLGSQVMETGTFTLRLVQKNSGKEYALQGKYLNLWQKVKDDNLLLITDAWNYDQYYDFQDQLRFEEIPAVHTALLPNVPIHSSISFELAALNRLLDATVTQHDGHTWSQYYADDAMLMTNYFPVFKGQKSIADYLHQHVRELPVFEELDIRNDRIDNLGMFIVEYASHIASWRNGNSSGVSMGKNIRIWRREPDHSLKLFRAIGMYD